MADYEYIDTTGTIIPDTSDLLTTVQNEYKAAFGADLVVTPDTPQGVLITAETLARSAVVRNNAALANQINPNIAGGVFLDAICALTGLQRTPATRSTVTASLTGVAGTIISAGARAKTANGDIFESTGTIVLDGSGLGSVAFQSVEYGPIQALSGTLDTIVTGIIGWESVTNTDAAAPGATEQTDQALRLLRRETLALQGVALPIAIIGALYDTPGVKSLTFRENIAATTQTIDGVSMAAHSIYACVDGGTDLDVATAILNNKSTGADYNGDTTVDVTEPVSGQIYAVKFARPTTIPIAAKATVKVNSSLLDPQTAVRQALLDYANGLLEGEVGLTVGSSVSSFELAGAVNREAPGIYVQKMEIKEVATGSFSTDEIPIAISEQATLSSGNISVVVV